MNWKRRCCHNDPDHSWRMYHEKRATLQGTWLCQKSKPILLWHETGASR